jgi:uncharacterized protein (TIGR02145 family)
MKHNIKLLTVLTLLYLVEAQAQAGIGTTTPAPSSILELKSDDKALLITRVANVNAIVAPVNGMLIYDLSENCFKSYQNDAWTGCGLVTLPKVIALECTTPTFTPSTISQNTPYSGSFSISYTGGNNLSYAAGSAISSTGVLGLTATLQPGLLSNNAGGTLTYTVSGTPASSGNVNFDINFGGQTCTVTKPVTVNLPANITLASIEPYFIASVFDQDYAPFTMPMLPASLETAQVADGTNEPNTVDIQGSLTTAGVTINIPYTTSGTVTLPAFSQTITIPASYTQDGISRDIRFSYPGATYSAGSGNISATLQALGGNLNAKKLDVQTGIGNDGLGWLLGEFSYVINSSGASANFQVRNIAGIPDRNIANANHKMLYLPITAADGKVWLNNNLGAHYSNTTHAAFNIKKQATSRSDFNAYGSLFQGFRYSDGHELVNWTSSTTGSLTTPTTTNATTDTPGNSLFITENNSPWDWRNPQNNNLWQGVNGINNPCPVGFRLPTNTEFATLVSSSSITNYNNAASSILKFTVPGFRNITDGLLERVSTEAFYWTSTIDGVYLTDRNFKINSSGTDTSGRAFGLSVRCIKD